MLNRYSRNLFFLIFLSGIFPSLSYSQFIGQTSYSFTDSSRTNRPVPCKLYYPAQANGNNTPVASGQFPLIVFGHGFVMTTSAYENFSDLLVPQGYILAFPETESGLSPNHQAFANDLNFLANEIPLHGVGSLISSSSFMPSTALMGHSMGGGCAFLAAQNNNTIQTLITFAAANTNPSSISAAAAITVPSLVFSGSNDCVTPPAQHQNPMYDSLSASIRTQIYISGGGHCYFANSNFNCSFGESTCTPSPAISRSDQQTCTGDFLLLWLDYFLKGVCQDGTVFQDSLLNSNRITYRQSGSISCTAALSEDPVDRWMASPNPFRKRITISVGKEILQEISIYNSFFERVNTQHFDDNSSSASLDFSALPNGFYILFINNKLRIKIIKI